ncbi:MAG: VTT domain-containing protein [Candidatus Moranbacteria bacterium]|nr:VTT domain-containing protein [Candidatus Moranbacteria bacterium]
MNRKNLTKELFPLIVLAGIFVLSAFLTQQYTEAIRHLIMGYNFLGIVFYVLAIILAIVIAPFTSIPLIPLSVSLWGIFWTIIISTFGWTLGSMIAFWIARKYGSGIVGKFVSLKKIKESYKHIPQKNLFGYLIFLRIVTPVDIISYALGLFTDIGWKIYFLTTLIGVIPATVTLAYIGSIPVHYQIIAFIIGMIVIIPVIIFHHPSRS